MNEERILAVVGHLAINQTIGRDGVCHEYAGGAGRHVAVAARSTFANVELISNCGANYSTKSLTRFGVGIDGVVIEPVRSDVFVIKELRGGERTFRAIGSMSSRVNLDDRKIDLSKVSWVHLATAPPEQQLSWIRQLKSLGYEGKISADSFELFIRQSPELVAKVFKQANLVFVNETEWAGVKGYLGDFIPEEMVLKMGSDGASWFVNGELMGTAGGLKIENVVDTTGAGEVVAGVFLGLRQKGCDGVKSLDEACRLASLSVAKYDIDHAFSRSGRKRSLGSPNSTIAAGSYME